MQDLYSFRQEEKHEDTMFIIYQEEKPQFATLSWLIGAGAGIRIGYLHYVKVMLATANIKRAYMSMHAAKGVCPVKAMDKPHMPIYVPIYMHVLFDTG